MRKVLASVRPTDGTDAVRGCRRCGMDISAKQRSAIYCGDNCRKRAHDTGR
jgi:hypothetical protein